MKKKILCIIAALCMVLCFTGCLDGFLDDSSSSSSYSSSGVVTTKKTSASEAAAPRSAKKCKDKNYKDIVEEFKKAGFTNIETESLEDMIIGLLVSEDEVKTVSIDGNDDFDEGDVFKKNAKVVVSYHSYPAKDSESESDKEKTAKEETTKEETTTTSQVTTTETIDTVITIQNNKDFAKVYNSDCTSSEYKAFSEKYYGRIIEFDGNIAYVDKYKNYKTRFNFLIYPRNYSETSPGPGIHMQIENENFYGLHLKGADEARMGMNVHIKARVGSYTIGELLQIDPIEMSVR